MVKKFLIFLAVFFFGASVCWSQRGTLDKNIVDASNLMIDKVFKEIYYEKDNYEELTFFSSKAIGQDDYGINKLFFQHLNFITAMKENVFEIGLSVKKMDDLTIKKSKASMFQYEFPLLGVKVDGYQKKFLNKHLNFKRIVDKYINILEYEQQKLLPLRLSLVPTKSTYKVGEKVRFKVTLTNKTDRKLQVKELDVNTLSFLLNGKKWKLKSKELEKRMVTTILKPAAKISNTFTGRSYDRPKELVIKTTYLLSHKGIYPSDTIIVNIVE